MIEAWGLCSSKKGFFEGSVNPSERIILDALAIGAMSPSEVAPSTDLVPPLLQNRVGDFPDHTRPIHGVAIGELFALTHEEAVRLFTHPKLKRPRIVRH